MKIEIPDFAEITEEGKRLLLEKTLKSNGIWIVHKSDADNIFPSDFHADRDDKPEKLDIYTGDVYSKTNKDILYKMPKKVMKYFYTQLSKSKEPEFLEKLKVKDKFTYLN